MDTAAWLALAALAAAVVIGIATVWATRRGVRRRRILLSYEASPLLPSGNKGGLLAVTFRDIPAENPYLVTVRIRNLGPTDLTTAHFDQGKPLRVDLQCQMLGVTRTSLPGSTISRAVGAEAVLELAPCLLRVDDEWVVEAVVDGKPDCDLSSPLIDTDVISGPSALEQAARILSSVIISVGGVTISRE
jgi:hypothetical protein